MSVIRSLFSAFLMYSRIPVPQVEWKEENRRYALCFFPIIGVVIGGIELLWYILCIKCGISELLMSAVMTAIPVVITGGIHLDGFCDVCDAKACCGTREKMLEVMSDSHIGAFAAIHLSLYFLIQAGLFSQINNISVMIICALGFVQSRAWSGLGAVVFKSAKNKGALQNFSKPAHKKVTVISELFFITAAMTAMVFIDPIIGICASAGGAAAFIYYRILSYKKFGGITGDLAGYFLQICELSVTAFAVFAEIVCAHIK